MDPKTRRAYDDHAETYASRWLQADRTNTHALVRRFFTPGKPTLDVGSGIGRDVAWLCEHDFPAEGVEVSSTLLGLARQTYPSRRFSSGSLPELHLDRRFSNILCRNVIMHLAREVHPHAVTALLRHLAPEGALLLTWRPDTPDGEQRDGDGRLYAHVDEDQLRQAARQAGAEWLHDEVITSGSSGKPLRVVALRRGAPDTTPE
ncbi:MAG: class I SAM-dependent methyltransferase [Proteobacteria bacterium]|nr:class I SAM-dependent methyltransferase [Pseudomonadota bacterium]